MNGGCLRRAGVFGVLCSSLLHLPERDIMDAPRHALFLYRIIHLDVCKAKKGFYMYLQANHNAARRSTASESRATQHEVPHRSQIGSSLGSGVVM